MWTELEIDEDNDRLEEPLEKDNAAAAMKGKIDDLATLYDNITPEQAAVASGATEWDYYF